MELAADAPTHAPAAESTPLLRARGLSKRYAGLVALTDYSLDLPEGRIHGVIGPNGAGKTTLFNLLSGMVRPTTGSIELAGREITGLRLAEVAQAGIARTFQNIRLFGDLSVIDNVRRGQPAPRTGPFWAAMLSTPGFRRRERATIRTRRGTCWSWSACPTSAARVSPAACPMAISGGWRSRGRWPRNPACSCSTSPTQA